MRLNVDGAPRVRNRLQVLCPQDTEEHPAASMYHDRRRCDVIHDAGRAF